MTKQDTGPLIDMPIDLLGSIAAFAYQHDDGRDHLRGVHVSAPHLELVATDGHRLVRVDLAAAVFHGTTDWERTCSSFLIPLAGIRAVVANGRNSGARYVKITHQKRSASPSYQGPSIVRFDVCGVNRDTLFTIESRTSDLTYPPIDQVTPAQPDHPPPEIVFDPRLLADIEPVLTALHAPRYGIAIKGWGSATSPMLFATECARFVVMPMPMRSPRPELRSV